MTKWGDDKLPNRALPPTVCFPNTTAPIKEMCRKARDCRQVSFQTSARFHVLSCKNITCLVMMIFRIHRRSCFSQPKIKGVPEHSYLNHWFGRSDRTPLIHFDCLYSTPVVKRDPLQSESQIFVPGVKRGPVIWSQRPRSKLSDWRGWFWANLGNENVVKVSLQSLPVHNCGSLIYSPQDNNNVRVPVCIYNNWH